MSNQPKSFSLGRLIAVVVPVVLVAFGLQYVFSSGVEQQAKQAVESNMLARILGPTAKGPDNAIDFKDADGDLVADSPADDQCVTPEKLVFTYIATPEAEDMPAHWQDVVNALSEKLGVPVEYVHYGTTLEQLAALAGGELHVSGFNTGAVPLAVRSSGFVPVCTVGRDDGDFGYTMRIIAPAGSEIKEPADLAGHKITFVRPDSNSGCKAALVLLMDEFSLYPESGYSWGFSLGHESSIQSVASGDFQAAPIASDIFERMAADGDVDPTKVQVVYESERFPPAALGYAHNLAPEMRKAIEETLLEFDWAGTSIEGQYGDDAVKFVPVNFKDDWANIRRIDEAVSKAREANAGA